MKRMPLMLYMLLVTLAGYARADSCTASMSDISFGNISPVADTDYYANGTLTVTCTWTLLSNLGVLLLPNANICLGVGAGSSGTITARTLVNGGATVPFNIYRSADYASSSIWGTSATAGTTAPVTTSMGGLLALGSLSQTFTIYGKIPAASLAGVTTTGGADTNYVSDFTGQGSIQYSFYGLLAPASDCRTGGSASFSFKARATVTNNCFINTTGLAFGSSNRVLTSAVRALGSVQVRCTANNPYRIALGGGSVTGNVAARKMRNAVTGETIRYLISATLDGAPWGDGTAGTTMVTGTGTGANQLVRMYGLVPAQTTPSPGEYKDTVMATLYF